MVINIAVGNQFSHLKLVFKTNKFFGTYINPWKKKRIYSNKHDAYAIEMKHRAIKIVLANKIKENDLIFLRKYIEYVFDGQTIGMYMSQQNDLFDDIKSVKIHKYLMRQ